MFRRGISRRRPTSRQISLRLESLESRLVMSVDATSALVSATDAMTEIKLGLYVRPVSIDQVNAQVPLTAAGSTAKGSLSITPAAGAAISAPYTPAQIRKAYGVDQLSYDGTGQTIAIIDAYDDSTVASDLAAFSTRFGLPAANLIQAVPNGTSYSSPSAPGAQIPGYNGGWAFETALDVEWAHAIAPKATILLVEAASANGDDLFSAVSYAVSQGASQVSMSWGGTEFSGVQSLDTFFNKTSVSFFAAAGDNGTEVEFPAVSPYVVGVGGTTVALDSAGNKISESAWNASGGGTSAYVTRPTFQNGFQTSATRGVPDVAYNGDPSSGVYVLIGGNYYEVGGTSAGAPQWAGLAALVNQGRVAKGLTTIGTGLANGLNTALYTLAGPGNYTNPNGDFTDITTGSNGTAATGGYDTVTGLGSPVANKLVPDLIAYGTTTSQPTTAPASIPTIGDPSFETVTVGASAYVYNPSGSAWNFTGTAGLTGNGSAFTNGNANAPAGQQVAFIQNSGTLAQTITNWSSGNYTLSFQAAQRGNFGTSGEVLQILIDGTLAATFKPTSTSYASYTTPTFVVTAGTHTVSFIGTNSLGDNTAFVDSVKVTGVGTPTPTPTPTPTTPTVGDASFEALTVGAGSFAVSPTSGTAWTFSNGGSGISGNGSGLTSGNPNAPDGQQVAFIQNTGFFSQSVANFAAGNYTLSLDAADRGNYGSANQALQILIDGVVVGTIKPVGFSYSIYTTPSFAVTAGTHTLKILGTATSGDNIAFIDAVAFAVAPTTTAPTVGDASFEALTVGAGSFAVSPTSGTAWTFSNGGSGISGNGSGLTSGNPNAPDGQQVAFIQNTGFFSQSVANFAAGNYTLSLDAADRGNYGSANQALQILIDGVVVGTIKPVGFSYSIYTTPSFAVTAGTHTLKILGTATSGDNIAFIDAVAFAVAPTTTAPTVGDASFEALTVGAGSFAVSPTSGTAWTFSNGGSGISGNGSGLTSGNPNAPDGQQVAFIQNTGFFSQSVANFAAGNYTLSLDAADRGNYGSANQALQILIDGVVVGTIKPVGFSYSIYTTPSFAVTAGTHTLKILGTATSGDNIAFIDAVAFKLA